MRVEGVGGSPQLSGIGAAQQRPVGVGDLVRVEALAYERGGLTIRLPDGNVTTARGDIPPDLQVPINIDLLIQNIGPEGVTARLMDTTHMNANDIGRVLNMLRLPNNSTNADIVRTLVANGSSVTRANVELLARVMNEARISADTALILLTAGIKLTPANIRLLARISDGVGGDLLQILQALEQGTGTAAQSLSTGAQGVFSMPADALYAEALYAETLYAEAQLYPDAQGAGMPQSDAAEQQVAQQQPVATQPSATQSPNPQPSVAHAQQSLTDELFTAFTAILGFSDAAQEPGVVAASNDPIAHVPQEVAQNAATQSVATGPSPVSAESSDAAAAQSLLPDDVVPQQTTVQSQTQPATVAQRSNVVPDASVVPQNTVPQTAAAAAATQPAALPDGSLFSPQVAQALSAGNTLTQEQLTQLVTALFRDIQPDAQTTQLKASTAMRDVAAVAMILENHLPQLSPTARATVSAALQDINDKLTLLQNLNNAATYAQIPININGRRDTLNLYVFDNHGRKGRIDPRNATLYMTLATASMGDVETMLRLTGRYVDVELGFSDDDAARTVAGRIVDLSDLLEAAGYHLGRYQINSGVRNLDIGKAKHDFTIRQSRNKLDIRV